MFTFMRFAKVLFFGSFFGSVYITLNRSINTANANSIALRNKTNRGEFEYSDKRNLKEEREQV